MFSKKEGFSAQVPNWANMLGDVVRSIADKTQSVRDRIRMSAVCPSWQASLVDEIQNLNFPVCLLLTEEENSDKRCLYNVSEEIFVELDLPEIRGRRCWGSPFGWLVTCGLDLEIRLFNPLSRTSLPLPSLLTFPEYKTESWVDSDPEYLCKFFLVKLILTSNPEGSGSDCIVLAVHSNRYLAFAKSGDKAWTPVDNCHGAEDAIYFKGNVFCCTCDGEILRCEDLYVPRPKAIEFAPPPLVSGPPTKYLFDLGGNLCLASRRIISHGDEDEDGDGDGVGDGDGDGDGDAADGSYLVYQTVGFEVFKLNLQAPSWDKMSSIGDCSLFLGNCCSFAISTSDYPGCKPNFIYFMEDQPDHFCRTGGTDMGIYNCEHLTLDLDEVDESDLDGLVDFFPKSKDVQHLLQSFLSPPLWFIPYFR